MSSPDVNYHQAPAPSYGESLRESLQAQLDLGPELFQAEASQYYGRPAYAQLETDILRDTLLGQGAPGRPAGVRDVTSENDKWEKYVELNPDLMSTWDQGQRTGGWAAQYDSIAEWGKAHYNTAGKNEAHRIVPQVGQSYDMSTGQVYVPDPNAPDAGTRSGGLLELLGGARKQDYGTGGIGEKFVTRKATQEDVNAGRAQYVGTEISDGRIRNNQMIGDTQEFIQTESRKPGYDAGDTFMGLAQYGSDLAEQAARRQRTADIADVSSLGGVANEALRNADPLAFGMLDTMGQSAQEGLAAGRGLSPRQRREAEQAARAGWEARGMVRDPEAVVSEVESVMEAAGNEEAKRRAFATQMMGASQAMTADPFMAILGRPSGASQQIAQTGLGSAGYGLSAGPGTVFDPSGGLNYMMNQQTNQANMQAAQAAASATKSAGMMGGLTGMAGSIGSAAILCWVAREVYGETNPKWKQFRSWVLNKAPEWFRIWYIINGESVAEHIKDKPLVKAQIKVFMDSKILEGA